MRRRPPFTTWSWPPPETADPREDEDAAARLSTGAVLASLGGALLGGIAFALHQRGALSPLMAAAFEAITDVESEGVATPPQPARPSRKKTRRRASPRMHAAPPPPPELTPDELDHQAAALLGVHVDASPDAIRAAFRGYTRARMHTAEGFGDLAHDPTETLRATMAKNRLIERARRLRT